MKVLSFIKEFIWMWLFAVFFILTIVLVSFFRNDFEEEMQSLIDEYPLAEYSLKEYPYQSKVKG